MKLVLSSIYSGSEKKVKREKEKPLLPVKGAEVLRKYGEIRTIYTLLMRNRLVAQTTKIWRILAKVVLQVKLIVVSGGYPASKTQLLSSHTCKLLLFYKKG